MCSTATCIDVSVISRSQTMLLGPSFGALYTDLHTMGETWRGGGGNAAVNFRFAVIELGTKRNLRF